MAGKTAQEIFGAGRSSAPGSARDLFTRARVQTRHNTRKPNPFGFKPREAPRVLNIHTKACKTCGGVITSITKYFCAGCHFKGWWWD